MKTFNQQSSAQPINPTTAASNESSWVLYRIDDQGNAFFMARFSNPQQAMDSQRLYEAKKHKQAYIITQESGVGAGSSPTQGPNQFMNFANLNLTN